MNMTPTPLAPYQAAVEELMSSCAAGISDLDVTLLSSIEQLEAGTTLAEIKGISDDQCDAIQEAVVELVRQGRSSDAVQPALMLAIHAPHDPRFCFIAGLCLQSSGKLRLAMVMYAMSIEALPTAMAALRLGECWVAFGKNEEALRCFESTIEFCGPDEDEIAQRADRAMSSVRGRALAV